MEYSGGGHVRKQLTKSDVQDRLVVTTDMAEIMPHADPEWDIPIKVLDNWGQPHDFYLSRRRGTYGKPIFQAKAWRTFIQSRGAQVGDIIYFWHEVNEIKHTEYRIHLLKNLFPLQPGLGDKSSS